jgi:hypothetical protein
MRMFTLYNWKLDTKDTIYLLFWIEKAKSLLWLFWRMKDADLCWFSDGERVPEGCDNIK